MMGKSASEVIFNKYFKPTEWPEGTLENMSAELFTHALFTLRILSGIPMWPSSLYEAHVRHDNSRSQHSTHNGLKLSSATDMHVSSIDHMIKVMSAAETIGAIGGIGIYFDTNTPMFHIDTRPERLTWIAFEGKNGKREYLYKQNDVVKFYRKLGELLQ